MARPPQDVAIALSATIHDWGEADLMNSEPHILGEQVKEAADTIDSLLSRIGELEREKERLRGVLGLLRGYVEQGSEGWELINAALSEREGGEADEWIAAGGDEYEDGRG